MESVLSIVRQVPGDDNWKPYLDSLKSKTDIITSLSQHLVSDGHSTTLLSGLPLAQLPQVSVGTGFLLSIQSEHLPDGIQPAFVHAAVAFLVRADPSQAKVIHKEVAQICSKLVSISIKHDLAMKVINALRNAVNLIAPSPTCLTPAHTYVLQACISTQMYSYAVEFIRSHEIFEINPGKTSLTVLEYLKYFYYCGMCFTAVKDFASALESFTQVIVTPAHALSHVVVCSIKRAKLISLIHTGTTFTLPARSLSNVVSRFWTQEMPVYDDIERHFKANNLNALSKTINEAPGYDLLQKDLNYGLAQQVLACHTKHRIRALTKTYITLSLQDIANKVSGGAGGGAAGDVQMVERHLLKMIRKGEIQASIDAVTGMVRFGDVSHAAAGKQQQQQSDQSLNATIEQALDQTVLLSDKLREMHKSVILSNSYLLKSVHGGSGGRGGGRGGGGDGGSGRPSGVPMDMDFPADYY